MTVVLGTWYNYVLGRKSLVVAGFLQLKLILMVPLLNRKHDLWLRGTLKPMAWTILALFPLLLR